MKKNIFIIFLFCFSLSSCVKIRTESIYTKCNSFVVKIDNADVDNILFYSKLKNSLEERLNLLVYDENTVNKKECEVSIKKINIKNYESMIDTSGIVSRNNVKIDAKYFVKIRKSIIENNCILFYGTNISENYYSAYVKDKKTIDDSVELLSERLYYSIINDVNKIKF